MRAAIVVIDGARPQGGGQGSSPLVAHVRRALGAHHAQRSPAMAVPERRTCAALSAALDAAVRAVDTPLLLVGHSPGGSVLLECLTEVPPTRPVRGLFLVAAPSRGATDRERETFALRPDKVAAIPPAVPVHLHQGRDDEVVPANHAERYRAEIPGAVLRSVDGCGHEFGHAPAAWHRWARRHAHRSRPCHAMRRDARPHGAGVNQQPAMSMASDAPDFLPLEWSA